MKKNLLIEGMIERNAVVFSDDPIDSLVAQRHFHGLLRQIQKTGRSYDITLSGRIAGRLQGAGETRIADA